MASLERRLKAIQQRLLDALGAPDPGDSFAIARWMHELDREQAILSGKEPPPPLPVTWEEILQRKASDEATVKHGSFIRYRFPPSPVTEEEPLADEAAAAERLERARDLPESCWGEIWDPID